MSRPELFAGVSAIPGPVALAMVGAVGCGGGDAAPEADPPAETPPATAAALPDLVTITSPGLHPEGIEWDAASGRFLVGSVTTGVVAAVGDDGTHEVLVDDPDVMASIGIHIDASRNRLYVAGADLAVIADPAAAGRAHLGAYDLSTGERIFLTDLAGVGPGDRHLANDMTVGPDGMVYVTNSMSPVIYAVTPDGTASAFVENDLFLPGQSGIGLNGLDVHPDGFLLVAHMGNAQILKIALDGSTVDVVELDEPLSGDGFVLMPDGGLAVVGSVNDVNGVYVVRSEDGWATATVAARVEMPGVTTGAVRDGEIYGVNPRFDDMGADPPTATFEITRARFQ